MRPSGKSVEFMSGLTHCVGATLAAVGLIVLIFRAIDPLKPWHLLSFVIFGLGMVGLYLASTLYHWVPYGPTRTRRLRTFDHIMIFVLIAASYTPICLVPLRGGWGWSLFGSVWAIALAGAITKLFWLNAPRWLSTALYIFMGWLVVVGVVPLVRNLETGALLWLMAGGLSYTVGGVIYAIKRPNPWPNNFGFHEIFHCFVLAGTLCHFWVMFAYIARLP
ncbi:MAG: hemolysin III family protein [Proteobacteria bacterium]|nr:hemolysin III family protein [Pseudomonadota bacterium]MBU1611478.1 hemolysin III family protein [Pseudomonadota bacterium]